MAWVDCMRFRRVAAGVRIFGWIVSALCLCMALAGTFVGESGEGFSFSILLGIAAVTLGITHLVAWLIDRHGDSLVTR